MNIASPWIITFNPAATAHTLVGYDQEINALIRWKAKQKLEEREVIEGAFTDFLPRGLKSCTVEFTTYADYTTVSAAHLLAGQRLALVQWDTIAPLDFADPFGVTLRMDNCAFESAEPEIMTKGRGRLAMRYVIKGRPPVQV